MKLNATSEMMPITWPEFANIHPFAPAEQTTGYIEMNATLNADLANITGFAAMSSQPNSGAQGEYAGLMCIKGYHASRGDAHRDICLIPVSAHGTNPASAVMAGLKVLTVQTDTEGNIDIEDLRAKATKHADKLAALMVTYPSTCVARLLRLRLRAGVHCGSIDGQLHRRVLPYAMSNLPSPYVPLPLFLPNARSLPSYCTLHTTHD